MADIQAIIDYYVNLLIIQYHSQPRAQATIALFAKELIANGIVFDVREAYNVDTAVGVQLDVIGKYVGVNRYYEVQDLSDYFAVTTYTEIDPDSDLKYGFTNYTDFNDYQYNGSITYSSILSQTSALNDEDYRVIIKLKILQNNINHSHKEIDDSVYKIFGTDIIPDSEGDMHMIYFVTESLTAIIKAALDKNLLPRPMGVGLTLIEDVGEPFFGFATYANIPTGNTGFTDYTDYDSSVGNTLIYDQVTPS